MIMIMISYIVTTIHSNTMDSMLIDDKDYNTNRVDNIKHHCINDKNCKLKTTAEQEQL